MDEDKDTRPLLSYEEVIDVYKRQEVQGEMGCRNCFASADAAAMEKIEAVKKSLGI